MSTLAPTKAPKSAATVRRVVTNPRADRVTVDVPKFPSGTMEVTVITAAGVQSNKYSFDVS